CGERVGVRGTFQALGARRVPLTRSLRSRPLPASGGEVELAAAMIVKAHLLALYALQRLSPLLIDRPRLRERERRGRRALLHPRERPARLDDHLRMRGDAPRLVGRRNARIERRAPGIAAECDLLP